MTWFRWSDSAPAEDMMVVSEMGEQWSPQTAPARQAEMPMMNSGLVGSWKTVVTMGMRIPKVPQDVPVANAMKTATTKMMAGSRDCRPAATPFMAPSTKAEALRISSPVVRFFREVARVRMMIGAIMAMKPSGTLFMASLNVMSFLQMR